MKQYFMKRIILAGLVLLTIPASLIAQKDKQDKDNKEVEQIIITRRGDIDEKTVIEIKGDKIKVNGKDVDNMKNDEITVRRNKLRDVRALARVRVPNGNSWNFDMDENRISLFSEDSNRAMLGVITDEDEKGAKITSITKESAAEKAGLKKGDIITKIDDKEIEDTDDISSIVRSHKPGDKVSITIVRDGKEQKISAELGKWKGVRMNTLHIPNPPIPHAEPGAPPQPFDFRYNYGYGGSPKMGISIQDTEDGKGVKVLEVAKESNAAKAGIQKDDVITQINGKEINSTDEVSRTIRENRDKASIRFQLQRGSKTENVEVRIPRKLKTADL